MEARQCLRDRNVNQLIIAHCGVRAMSYINCYRNSDEELSNSGNGGVKEKYQKEGNTWDFS